EYEIKTIREIPESDCVKAFWRAGILRENVSGNQKVQTLYNDMMQKVVDAYNKSLSEQKYLDSLGYYESLKAMNYPRLSQLAKSDSQLRSLINSKVPGLGNAKPQKSVSLSSTINGTVTVFVDKGVKVEKGVGRPDAMLGSGFFISSDGYIITNHHIISSCVDPKYEGFARCYIKLAEDPDTRIPAKIVGWDSTIDLALLKAEVRAPYVFTLGSSSDLNVGDKVYAIGSPLGLDRTLTSGIISAKDRELFTSGKVFQIDAAVNSGNSGGPLIDSQARVQAIVFAGVQNYQGLNFAIPVEYLRYELPLLAAGGKRRHPWTGAYGKTKRLPGSGAKNEGLSVMYTMPGSPAYLAGLEVGQTIVAIGGTKVTSLDDLQYYLMQRKAGSIVRVTTLSEEGVRKEHTLYLNVRPDSPGYEVYTHDLISGALVPILGTELVRASSKDKREYTISMLIKGSLADVSGFSEGDPVKILSTQVSPDKTAISLTLYARKRKNGFLDVGLGLAAPLDSPYYF
ncbi:MAG: trypsin-like peptidase domain-containing protein, partial [Treponema sp.]|nr:trypsin-like peptidase domain-containing protein [Treponema sp.]